MDLGALIGQYGLPIVLLGSLLEGEAVLILAGFADVVDSQISRLRAHGGRLVLSDTPGGLTARLELPINRL